MPNGDTNPNTRPDANPYPYDIMRAERGSAVPDTDTDRPSVRAGGPASVPGNLDANSDSDGHAQFNSIDDYAAVFNSTYSEEHPAT